MGALLGGRRRTRDWPWIQIVRAVARACDGATLKLHLGIGAPFIAHLVPEIASRLPELTGVATPVRLDSDDARFFIFDAMVSFLRSVAGTQPLVLVLDDLHAAHESSLRLLEFLAGELRTLTIFVIGTYRTIDTPEDRRPFAILDAVARHGEKILLSGLERGEAGQMIHAVAGVKPSGLLVDAVHQATDGNPLFVNEVTRLLIAQGGLAGSPRARPVSIRIPESARETVGRRLRLLSAKARDLLSIASVIGKEFERQILEMVDQGESIEAALNEAVAARVIEPLQQAPGRFTFSHSLIREALYDGMAQSRRTTLHGMIARALEDLNAVDADARLAHHFLNSGKDPAKALLYSKRAGDCAVGLLAYEEAIAHYQRALDLFAAGGSVDEALHCELLLALGDAHRRAGEMDESKATFSRAAAGAQRSGLPEVLARAALGYSEKRTPPWSVDRETVSLLERALAALSGHGDSSLAARARGQLAIELYFSRNSVERRRSLSHEAVESARRLGDPTTLAFALSARLLSLAGPDSTDDPAAVGTEILGLAHQARDPQLILWGYAWRIRGMMEAGSVDLADADIAAMGRELGDLREPQYRWAFAFIRATRTLLDARYEEAEALSAEALGFAQTFEPRQGMMVYTVQMLMARLDRGGLEQFDELFRSAPPVPGTDQTLVVARARVCAELGRIDEARSLFESFAASEFAELRRDFRWIMNVCSLSVVASILNDGRGASKLYNMLMAMAQKNAILGLFIAYLGAVPYYLGLLAKTVGQIEEAVEHFEDALRMHLRMRSRSWVARTQCELGAALLSRARDGDPERARALVDDALCVASELGIPGIAAKARELAATLDHQGDAQGSGRRPSSQAPPEGEKHTIIRSGDVWTIEFRGKSIRLRDSRGLRYIAHLLEHPRRDFHSSEMLGLEAAPDDSADPRKGDVPRRCAASDAGPILDAQAKAEYRRRLEDLKSELEEARAFNDLGRISRAEEEIAFLSGELSAAVGLGGRDRKAASEAERARVSVTRAIRLTIRKIIKQNPSLGHHLDTTVRTGNFFSYEPDPAAPPSWKVRA